MELMISVARMALLSARAWYSAAVRVLRSASSAAWSRSLRKRAADPGKLSPHVGDRPLRSRAKFLQILAGGGQEVALLCQLLLDKIERHLRRSSADGAISSQGVVGVSSD